MLYMTNASSPTIRAAMIAGRTPLGQMCSPAEGRTPLPGVIWSADNGCFGQGWPGEDRWLAWLERHAPDAHRCLFATAPDIVANAVATLDRSFEWFPVIRQIGYRAALVAQDGLERLPVPWSRFDVLFVGGSSCWKTSQAAADLVLEATRRAVPCHFGRVNPRKRYLYAARLGCASVDGTFLTYAPDRNLARLAEWMAGIRPATTYSDMRPRWRPREEDPRATEVNQ